MTPTIADIIQATADRFQLPVEALVNKSARSSDVTHARHVAMYIANRIAFFSHDEIAEAFRVHRTCVTHAAIRVARNRKVKADIEAITVSIPSASGPRCCQAPVAAMPSPTWSGNPVIPRLARWSVRTFVSPVPRMEVAQ